MTTRIKTTRCKVAQGLCGNPATKRLAYEYPAGRVYETRPCCADEMCNDLARKNTSSLGIVVTEKPL